MKRCGTCEVEKPLEAFATLNGVVGARRRCKACDNAATKERHRRDPEPFRERARQRHLKVRADPALYAVVRQQKRDRYAARGKTQQQERLRQMREQDFFRFRARQTRRWLTPQQLEDLWVRQNGRCALTGRPLTTTDAQVDHKIPRARGGPDTYENARWVLRRPNEVKRDLLDEELVELCRDILETLGATFKTK